MNIEIFQMHNNLSPELSCGYRFSTRWEKFFWPFQRSLESFRKSRTLYRWLTKSELNSLTCIIYWLWNSHQFRAFSLTGLLIIAIGTGGIKPCVSAFGGDQFVRPQQDRQLETFFSIFYISINAGSLLSTFITPILREDVQCFDQASCFPLAFGVPAILMIIAVSESTDLLMRAIEIWTYFSNLQLYSYAGSLYIILKNQRETWCWMSRNVLG